MHSHLVAVEVGVKGGTHQRVQLDGAAFDQHRVEGLDAQAVQRGGAVQQHRMVFDDLLEYVPHFRLDTLDKAFRALDVVREVLLDQFAHDERFEEFQGHLFRETALVQLQIRADHDDGAARVVNALAEQVLTEAPLLALEHIGQALELVVAGTGYRAPAPPVVDEGIAGFLQHALFVAYDDLRRAEFEQSLEAVVAVDDAAVEVVQVGCGEASAVELHHGAQFWRQHRQHREDHPLRRGVGLAESFDDFQALGGLFAVLAYRRGDFAAQVGRELLE